MNSESRQNTLRGDLWAIVSALATGFGLTAGKIILATHSAFTFNTYLYFIGSLIIAFDAIIFGKLREMIFITKKQLGFFFIVAILFAASTFCFFSALQLAQPATASFLSRLELVTTILLAYIFLNERFNPAEIIGLVIVIIGIVVMRYGASVELSKAIIFATAGAIFSGAAEVTLKGNIKKFNYRSLIFYRGLFMTPMFIVAGTFMHRIELISDGRQIGIMIIAAVFLPYLGRMGYLKAMKYINVSRASIIVQSQPIFAALAALAILQSFPHIREFIGGLIIVAGVIIMKLTEKRALRKQGHGTAPSQD